MNDKCTGSHKPHLHINTHISKQVQMSTNKHTHANNTQTQANTHTQTNTLMIQDTDLADRPSRQCAFPEELAGVWGCSRRSDLFGSERALDFPCPPWSPEAQLSSAPLCAV